MKFHIRLMASIPGSRNVEPDSAPGTFGTVKVPVDRDINPSAMRAHRLSFRQSNQQTRDGTDDDVKVN
jgi:hypothetical protein